jgi:hypothetical protein
MKKVSVETNQRTIRAMRYLEYKDYTGSLEYDEEDNLSMARY